MSEDALFVYGSLLVPRIRTRLIGRAVDAMRADLPAHERRALLGTPYPAVRACPGATVDGELLTGLSRPEFARLDEYEGELYQRSRVNVRTPTGVLPAFVYLIRPPFEHRLAPEDWSFEKFRKVVI